MKRILVAPLDWGLGHATRCIPIIHYLIEKKIEVVIGGDGRAMQLLRHEFPHLEYVLIPGYAITYPSKGSMVFSMAMQLPKIIFAIVREHRTLKEVVVHYKIDAVISDNRYGLWHPKIPCIFITHQLHIPSPLFKGWVNYLNRWFIKKYAECWIPDVAEEAMKLAGDLSGKKSLPTNAKYIGWLSRFEEHEHLPKKEYKRKLLVILSGPEPQRTLFEKMVLHQLDQYKKELTLSALIVQGKPEEAEKLIKIGNTIARIAHLPTKDMQEAILSSEIIISRSGYSTIMDLVALKKKAILIPTPGQMEQEYLAAYLSHKNIFCIAHPHSFDLMHELNNVYSLTGIADYCRTNEYKSTINLFLGVLLKNQ